MLKLGVLFPVCDADSKHFDRFAAELTRLGFPFAVHFDHCSDDTKRFFTEHPLHLGNFQDDDPKSTFDESKRESARRILDAHKFDMALQMDVDETLEKLAPEKIAKIRTWQDIDVVMARCLDLWEDDKHYRVDGPFGSATREKFHRLNRGKRTKYTHPISHAPYFHDVDTGIRVCDDDVKIAKLGHEGVRLHVLHWGIMNMEDAEVHRDRWHKIFLQKCGNIPYGSYIYYWDPGPSAIRLADFDYDTFTGD